MKKLIFVIVMILSILMISGCDTTSKIIVKFDSDGGNINKELELTESQAVADPGIPEKINYIFEGWFLGDTKFDFATIIDSSITLKAKWSEGVYIYIGGSGIEDQEILIPVGTTYDLPTFEREGYKFVGWINSDTDEYVDSDYIYEEDTFLEISWEKKERITYEYYYNSVLLATEYRYVGEDYTPYVYERVGLTFGGWFTDSTFKNEFDFNSTTKSNKLYGKFTANTYTISFEYSTKTITATYGSKIGTMPSCSVTGCTFVNWEYEGEKITANMYYLFTEDVTLTPVLRTKSTFVVDDTTTKTVQYIIGDVTPYVSVEKEGYIFAGWYDNAQYDGEAIYVITTADYANKTLYARWETNDEDNSLTNEIVDRTKDYYRELFDGLLAYENLTLPSKDAFYGCELTWSSNLTSSLLNNGIIRREKENVSCKLTLGIKYGSVNETVEFDVIIKGDPYKDISQSVISSYVYTGTYSNRLVDDILLETADIINLSFVVPQSDGSIIVSADYVAKLNAFYQTAYDKGVRVILCVGGSGTAEVFDAIAKDDIIRAEFVQNIMNIIKQYNLAGVDIDWEYPTAAYASRYTTLMKDIYEAVKEYDPEALVTSAIPAGPWGYPKFELKKSAQYLDYINLMSYDLHCHEAGYKPYHHTALYKSDMTYNMCSIEESVNLFNKTLLVPLEKIIIGAAFYGRYSTVTSATGTVTDSIVGSSMRYNTIVSNYLTNNSNVSVYWDSAAHAPYLYDSNEKVWISYDNVQSIQDKCDYVVSKKVGGIMWWDYGSDSTGTLIEAINGKLSILK